MGDRTEWTFALYLNNAQVSWAKAVKGPKGWTMRSQHGGTSTPTTESRAKSMAKDFLIALRRELIREGKGTAPEYKVVEL